MSAVVPVAFNVIGNSTLCFGVSFALVVLARRTLGLGPGRLRLLLWLAPFAKVLWELRRGVPAQSFVWVHALGAKQDLGSFQFGFGLALPSPLWVQAVLSAHSKGITYSQSAADLLYRALSMKVSPAVPSALVLCIAVVSSLRLVRRLASLHAFRVRARELVRTAQYYTTARSARGAVRVYASALYEGAPFAAGIAHPYVLFSESSLSVLDAGARRAAIEHEIAHIDRCDPLLITSLLLFVDAFWFLPGASRLLVRIFGDVEVCADQRAVKRGASPIALADALVSVGEQLTVNPRPALSLSGEKSLLRERIERLCRPERASSRLRQLATALCVALFISSILHSMFFGN